MIYLDYNAGTPLLPVVKTHIAELLTSGVFNPSSPHKLGRDSRYLIETARANISQSLFIAPENLIFTASASEANNHALNSFETLMIGKNTHPSLSFMLNECDKDKIILPINITKSGRIDQNHLDDCLNDLPVEQSQMPLLCCFWAHSESGVIEEVEALARLGLEKGFALHIDGVQAIARLDLSPLKRMPKVKLGQTKSGGLASLALSGHKLGAPAGIGALACFGDFRPKRLIGGGAQERGQRAGTENLLGIAALNVAFDHARKDYSQEQGRLLKLRQKCEDGIKSICPNAIIIAQNEERIANTISVITPNLKSQTQLIHFDLAGIMLSAGSACSSGKISASSSLLAQGYNEDEASCVIRLSMGEGTVSDDIEGFLKQYKMMMEKREL